MRGSWERESNELKKKERAQSVKKEPIRTALSCFRLASKVKERFERVPGREIQQKKISKM